jgi:hypothetical protein
VTAEAAGSGGNHLGRVTISPNRSDKILHSGPAVTDFGEPGIALVVAVMEAGRVTCWCGTSKLARLHREQES